MTTPSHSGGCLCGGVRYVVDGPLAPVVNCHCGQCQRFHGSAFGAYTEAPKAALRFETQASLAWFASSPGVGRGFCSTCGSSLFWQEDSGGSIGIAAGTLDQPSGLATAGHIFVRSKADFTVIADDLWQKPEGSG